MISPVDDAKDAAHSVQDSGAYRFLVRGGLVAFGVVHFLVGVLAIRVAMGDGGEEASQSGALRTLSQNALGPWLLGAVALGLFVIALWQLITAFVGHRQFDGAKRIAKRLSSVLRTILYAFLGYQALQIALFGGSSKQGDEGEESITASLLALPFGGAIVALAGLGIVGYGIYQIVKAVRDKYNDDLSSPLRGRKKWIARIGVSAKGVAVGIVGSLFVAAGLALDPEEAGGMDQALQQLNQMPFGPWLLGAVAVGLAAYGVYCFFWSRRPKFT